MAELPGGQDDVEPEGGKNSRNNHVARGTDTAPRGDVARYNANLRAIRLSRQIADEERQATPKEMAVLRQYSGWGGLGGVFNDPAKRRELAGLIGEQAMHDAQMSANSAYFTPAAIIDRMWDIARKLGFRGGRVLEGSAGIGNILGLMPEDLSGNSDIEAVEIDPTTGTMLAQLYPDAKVNIAGFERTRIENGSVDLAITNVPFVSGLKVFDDTGDKDLSKRFGDIHDFCIAKNIRKLRPGGIGIFITTSGTLDKSRGLRQWATSEADTDFIGAFRLNNRTFGGTSVTSDIVVVRRRIGGERSPQAIDVADTATERTAQRRFQDEDGKWQVKTVGLAYNAYFQQHPEHMAGEMGFGFEHGDTFRPESKGLYPKEGKDQRELLDRWAAAFHEETRAERTEREKQQAEAKATAEAEGRMFVGEDGRICISRRGKAVPAELREGKVKGHTKEECLEAYRRIGEARDRLLAYQRDNATDGKLPALLAELGKAYDSFVADYGRLHSNTAISFLKADADFAATAALEDYKEMLSIINSCCRVMSLSRCSTCSINSIFLRKIFIIDSLSFNKSWSTLVSIVVYFEPRLCLRL